MTTNIDQLKNRDYYLVLDKSGSMEERDCPGGKTRWQYLQESVQAITNKIAEYDPDGVTVIPFSGTHKVYPNTTPQKVKDVFTENSPMGSTLLAAPLSAVFNDYLSAKKAGTAKSNGAMCIVVTDGQPSDEREVAQAIVNFTKQLENGDGEFGIAMLQVGKDAGATAFLKRLDDDLVKEGAKFDIVDTKTIDDIETIGLTEALTAALTD